MEASKPVSELLTEELMSEVPEAPLNSEQLQRIAQIVNEYNTKVKCHLTEQQEKHTSRAERLADKVADFGGSWLFIISFIAFLLLWMVWNVVMMTLRFDEPPYILLNLVLSCISALQAPFILMSQNRQANRDKQEALLNFAITYKAEKESSEIRKLLRNLEDKLNSLHPEAAQYPQQGGNEHET